MNGALFIRVLNPDLSPTENMYVSVLGAGASSSNGMKALVEADFFRKASY